MKKILRFTFLTVFFAAIVFLCAVALPTQAQAATFSDLTYKIEDGQAFITGCNYEATGSLTIPSSIEGYPVTEIYDYAFEYCSGLTSITFPSSLTTIRYYAFRYCTGLTSITIPEGVTVISAGAFSGCSNLSLISIPSSITYIGYDAFYGTRVSCTRYNNGAYIGNSKNPYLVLAYIQNTSSTTFTAHPDTKIVYSGAFANCGLLQSVSLPDGVTCIGDYAFHYNLVLKNITLPAKLQYIGYKSFEGCQKLSSITIPGSVTFVDDDAFRECLALKTATIKPGGLVTLGWGMFSGCSAMTSVSLPQNIKYIGQWAFEYCTSLKSITLPNSIEQLDEHAFAFSGLTQISIPESVTELGAYAFSGCEALTQVTVPGTISNIGYGAFQDCTNLKTAVLEQGVTTLTMSAFHNCPVLTTVVLPSTLTEIGSMVFDGSAALRNVCYTGTAQQWGQISIGIYNDPLSAATVYYSYTAPSIILHPSDKAYTAGKTALFSVRVLDPNVQYQWQYRASKTGKWVNTSASGYNTNLLQVPVTAGRDGYQYRCMVTDSFGISAVTNAATLRALYISQQPVNRNLPAGKTASFTVKAGGAGLKYQWQYRASADGKWANATATGNKTATVKVPVTAAKNGFQYRCKITDSSGNVLYSKIVNLKVVTLKVTQQPVNRNLPAGKTASFTVKASGASLKYQWQYRTSTTAKWANATATGNKTATLNVPVTASRNGYQYRCRITDTYGNVIYSNAATLKAVTLKVTQQPVNRNLPAGKTASFTVKASGASLKYQWQYRTSKTGKWTNATATGNKTAALKVPVTAAKNGFQYRCRITDTYGNVIYSNTVNLKVVTLKITAQPVNKALAPGKTAVFTVKATGTGLKYQWQYRTSATGKWINATATGNKTATLQVAVTNAKNGFQYRCVITDTYANRIYSNAAKLTVR